MKFFQLGTAKEINGNSVFEYKGYEISVFTGRNTPNYWTPQIAVYENRQSSEQLWYSDGAELEQIISAMAYIDTLG